jgi:transcriptional pleiotropic regulator of transition state genes
MEYNKKLNKVGSLTIPAAMRRELGINQGERFKIIVQEKGSIELRRIQGECIFCKSDKSLIVYEGRYVCGNCLKKINQIISERSDKLDG